MELPVPWAIKPLKNTHANTHSEKGNSMALNIMKILSNMEGSLSNGAPMRSVVMIDFN